MKRKIILGAFVAAMALTGFGLRVAHSLHLFGTLNLADPIIIPVTPPPY